MLFLSKHDLYTGVLVSGLRAKREKGLRDKEEKEIRSYVSGNFRKKP